MVPVHSIIISHQPDKLITPWSQEASLGLSHIQVMILPMEDGIWEWANSRLLNMYAVYWYACTTLYSTIKTQLSSAINLSQISIQFQETIKYWIRDHKCIVFTLASSDLKNLRQQKHYNQIGNYLSNQSQQWNTARVCLLPVYSEPAIVYIKSMLFTWSKTVKPYHLLMMIEYRNPRQMMQIIHLLNSSPPAVQKEPPAAMTIIAGF